MPASAKKIENAWLGKLTPEQYRITRQKGTEPAYSGRFHDFNESGIYRCICCGHDLFSSKEKFSVRAKWPVFWAPVRPGSVATSREIFHFVVRNEVTCARCDAHLGYVFEDGRPPTGVRYFINSAALQFVSDWDQPRIGGAVRIPACPHGRAYCMSRRLPGNVKLPAGDSSAGVPNGNPDIRT